MSTQKIGRAVERNSNKESKEQPETGAIIIRAKDKDHNKEDLTKAKRTGPAKDETKSKKPGARHSQTKKGKKDQQKETKVRKKQKSCFDKFMQSLGLNFQDVKLRDPRAIEAAQALNLQPWHLRKMKLKFDVIDVDGSGNIDSDEFFEAVGEQRSPLTDRLFSMIDLDGSGTIEFDEYVRVSPWVSFYRMNSNNMI